MPILRQFQSKFPLITLANQAQNLGADILIAGSFTQKYYIFIGKNLQTSLFIRAKATLKQNSANCKIQA